MRLEQVRSDWTVLGSADPLWAVLVSPDARHHGWSPEQFLATGRIEIDRVLAHIDALGLRPGHARALDFGCGVGRLTNALATHFDHVVGVDISPTMLETARTLVSDERCEFVENDAPHLERFADDSVDLAVSSLVLQHMPPDLAEHMLGELIRVTRPGGVVVVQVAEQPDLSARGLATRVLPRSAMRWAQQRVLGYPAPMDMFATSRATVERVIAGRARIANTVVDAMYGGHWRYRRYYLAVAGPTTAPGPDAEPEPVPDAVPAPPADTSESAPAPAREPPVESRAATVAALQWLRARPERLIWVGALLLAVLQTVLRGVLAYRGSFYIDDFGFTGRAARLGLSPHWLFHEYNSHIMPGSFVWVWATTKLAPLSYAPVATVDIVLQAVIALQFYRLLRDLFGVRPAILVPYAVYLLSPVTLPAFLWWAAALNQLPQQLAIVLALRCHVAYLRTGRVRRGVLGVAAFVFGLAFSEKSLLIVPLVFGTTLLCFTGGGPVRRSWNTVVRHWRVWLAYLVVTLPYAIFYELAVPSPVRALPSGASTLGLVDVSFRDALLPGLLGGPWRWRAIGSAGGLANPPAVVSWIVLAAVLVFLAVTVARRRGAVFGWALAAGYGALNLALLDVSRATFIGPFIGHEYRYITDVALVATIGGALAMIPLRGGGWAAAEPVSTVRRAGWSDGDADRPVAIEMLSVLVRPWSGRAGSDGTGRGCHRERGLHHHRLRPLLGHNSGTSMACEREARPRVDAPSRPLRRGRP